MFVAKAGGVAFISWMAWCWIVPAFKAFWRSRPSAFIKYFYSGTTLFGLFWGLSIVSSRELNDMVQGLLDRIFQEGLTPGRLNIVVFAVCVSLSFVMGNLARSYYNLSSIEDDHENSPLRIAVSGFEKGTRIAETGLRLLMFGAIVALADTMRAIHNETSAPNSPHNQVAFRIHYDQAWLLTLIFYFLVFIWDFVVWFGYSKPGQERGKPPFSRLYTFAVHSCGLIVSMLMLLPLHSQFVSTYADIAAFGALLAAITGCVLLCISAYERPPGTVKPLETPQV